MKKIILFVLFSLSIQNGIGQNYYMATPQGFGANVTGGGNATPVTVSTYTAFKNALLSTSTTNAVILVSGTIDCTYTSVQLNNKTIIGLPGAKLRNIQIIVGNSATSAANSGILNIKPNSNNVIIRNLIFEGPGAYDVDGRDNLTNEGTNIWVDHCEFQDGMDGNFDNKGSADNVTISWCKFTYLKAPISGGSGGSNDHRFTNLVGSSSSDAPSDGNYSITFQNCYWASGCKERMPRARNAELHLVSCYYNTAVSNAKALGLGGGANNTTCYVENTDFTNISNVYTNYSGDGGTVSLVFNNCLNGVSNVGTVSAPSYSTTPIPVNEVEGLLTDTTCGAGATLQVTGAGVVTPNDCASLYTASNDNQPFQFYTSMAEKTINIHFSIAISNNVSVDVYTLNGQKIISHSDKRLNANETLKIGIENLSNGTYICHIKFNDTMELIKFIKN
ncbi:T9SS type A sorting domain-containing protein [Flavobacterium jejuense]|uniref:T9SS type A sorting domain-containing protein n=1 Tax=Flavobacterium jejuense TaxID=1544455 RepID=A0ABX0IRH0_9FLAO|nr:T9SS type A sorting domain-containing protein [Flavobacterium jejuense]NHN25816.1 T9SS type A sorting domain-containing protein [Flavobacterium jejuense]